MGTKARFVCKAGLLGLLCLAGPGVAVAGTIYTLTGDAYNVCSGSYSGLGGSGCGPYFLSGTFEVVAGTNLDNLSPGFGEGALLTPEFHLGNLDPYITSFSFQDGNGLTIRSTDPGAVGTFNIATDAHGNITWWYLDVCFDVRGSCGSSEESYWFPSYPQTFEVSSTGAGVGECFAFGVSSPVGNCGGQWSAPTTSDVSSVPEPSSVLLIAAGLLGLGARASRGRGRRLGLPRRSV